MMKTLRRITLLTVAVVLAFAPAVAQVNDWKKIKYPKLPAFDIPQPEIYTLDNGVQVFLMEDHELPLISANVRFRTGSNQETADKIGLSSIYASVLRDGGTTARSADEIDEWLAARAATIEISMGGDVMFGSMDSLKEDFDDVLSLFREFMDSPALPDDKIDLAKTQEKTGIARRNDDVGQILGREFAKLVRGDDSPLAWTTEYATIDAISRDDLVAWHERYVHPNRMMIGVVGDFDTAAMKTLIADVFGDWEKGPEFELPEVPYRKEPLAGMYFIEKTDVTQARIQLGHLGIRQDDPDYFAVQILNEVLSGGFTSRLFGKIRTEMGLAYNVYGSVGSSFLRPGVFQAGTQTKSETMAVALQAMQDVMKGVIDNPPTDAEIQRAKDGILQSFVFNYTSRDQILSQQMNYAYYGLPLDYLEQYRSNIEKVTREQVAAAAKKHLRPDEYTILVVGNPADFDKPLDDIGTFAAIDIAITPPADTGPAVVRSEATLAKGREVFDRVVASMGGSDPGSITGYTQTASMTVKVQGQSLPIKQAATIVFPNRVHMKINVMGQEQTVVIDGESGFMAAMGQVRDLPGEAVAEQKESIARDMWFLVKNHDSPEFEAVYLDAGSVDGTDCDQVEVSFTGIKSLVCVDADGRIIEQSFQGKNPLTQAPGRITNRFSDFRDVDGRAVAYTNLGLFEGEEFMSGTVESFELDPEVAEDVFARPAS